MTDLQQWLASLTRELGLTDVVLDEASVTALLDLTRDCAHEVERIAGPLSTYLLGVAVGRGADLGATVQATTALLAAGTPPTQG